ncbi:hypothetical protein [Hoeflea sp.]|uniref:hypothetical protein n=1 Tax=Hoeflea sp. TaxID=1940281 RepID=UPI003A9076C4
MNLNMDCSWLGNAAKTRQMLAAQVRKLFRSRFDDPDGRCRVVEKWKKLHHIVAVPFFCPNIIEQMFFIYGHQGISNVECIAPVP